MLCLSPIMFKLPRLKSCTVIFIFAASTADKAVVPDFKKSCSRDLWLGSYYLLPNISGTGRKVYMG